MFTHAASHIIIASYTNVSSLLYGKTISRMMMTRALLTKIESSLSKNNSRIKMNY